jgi:hypothetical protein
MFRKLNNEVLKMNIFKIEYFWYEGEHEEVLLGKNIEREEFERDIIKAKEFAESIMKNEIKECDYLGKGYRVNCLPEYYEQIVWFLTEKVGYILCSFEEKINYQIDDKIASKITITKVTHRIDRKGL